MSDCISPEGGLFMRNTHRKPDLEPEGRISASDWELPPQKGVQHTSCLNYQDSTYYITIWSKGIQQAHSVGSKNLKNTKAVHSMLSYRGRQLQLCQGVPLSCSGLKLRLLHPTARVTAAAQNGLERTSEKNLSGFY